MVHILESVFMTYWLTISEMLLSEMARATPIKSLSTSRALSRFLAFLGKVAKLRKWLLFSSCPSVCLQLHLLGFIRHRVYSLLYPDKARLKTAR